MPIDRLILCGRGSFWKSSLRLRIGSPPNGSTCSNMGAPLGGERRLDVALHREGDTVVGLAELGDLLVRAGVLGTELVAREADHDQALVAIALPQPLQAAELRREAALARGVDDQEDLAALARELGRLASDRCGLEVVDALCGLGHGVSRCSRLCRW